jgi:hypothetical protein
MIDGKNKLINSHNSRAHFGRGIRIVDKGHRGKQINDPTRWGAEKNLSFAERKEKIELKKRCESGEDPTPREISKTRTQYDEIMGVGEFGSLTRWFGTDMKSIVAYAISQILKPE